MRWLCGIWAVGCALACGGGTPTSTTATPVPEPQPEPEPEVEPLDGYAYVPSTSGPARFSEAVPGEQLFVGVDGAKLRARPDAEGDVLKELPLAAKVKVVQPVGEPVEEVGRWNRWVEVEHEGSKGFLFGSLLTPFGGQQYWEAGGETRWAVLFSRDFKPLVRIQGENATEATSLELTLTERFRGGSLQAETDNRGDFDGVIEVTQCAPEERTDGPSCVSGTALVAGELTQLTPVEAWRYEAQPASGNCGSEQPVQTVAIDYDSVKTVTMPSYMRGPSTMVDCRRVARVQGGVHDGRGVIACRQQEGGKSEPSTTVVRRFIEVAPDRWGRLACSGGIDHELEESLLYQELHIDDLGDLVLTGRFVDPPTILEGPRGQAERRTFKDGDPTMDLLEKFAEHPELGPLYRARARATRGNIWTEPERSGIVVPRIEGGFTSYAWQPNLEGLVLSDGTVPAPYTTTDELEYDFHHPDLKESELALVGSMDAGSVWGLPVDHPLHAELLETAKPVLERGVELGTYPWLFVRGPDDVGFYRLVRSDLQRPMMAEPILYAYADEPTALSIAFGAGLIVRGTHPPAKHGWDVVVHPDGALEDASGAVHDRLFWDGVSGLFDPPRQGWIVRGDQLEPHLRRVLPELGLLPGREIDEALEAWLPTVRGAPWVRVGVHPPADVERLAPLEFDPQPDTLIRVMVELQPLDRPVRIEPPAVVTPERRGLTVVEWGYVVRNPGGSR